MIFCVLLAIIFALCGMLVRQHNKNLSAIAQASMAINKCGYITEKQEKIITITMRAFKL